MRTPLTGVIGVTQLALDASEQPEVVRHLKIVQLSAKGLLSLINDVLDFSKIEAGLMEVVRAPLAVRPFVTDLCLMVQQEASLKGLLLKSVVDESAPEWVSADDTRLRQVLLNLVTNAIKFTARGTVTINVGCAAEQLSFAVADTGIGIPADKREVIFDAFRQSRQLHFAALRRHRFGADDLEEPGGVDGRADLARKRTRAGKHVFVCHGSTGRGRSVGRAARRTGSAGGIDEDPGGRRPQGQPVPDCELTPQTRPQSDRRGEWRRSAVRSGPRHVRRGPDGHSDAGDGRPGGSAQDPAGRGAVGPASPRSGSDGAGDGRRSRVDPGGGDGRVPGKADPSGGTHSRSEPYLQPNRVMWFRPGSVLILVYRRSAFAQELAPESAALTPAPPYPSPETPGCAGAPTAPAHPPARSISLRLRTETPPGPPPCTSGPDRASPPPTSVSTGASTAASGRPGGPT